MKRRKTFAELEQATIDPKNSESMRRGEDVCNAEGSSSESKRGAGDTEDVDARM